MKSISSMSINRKFLLFTGGFVIALFIILGAVMVMNSRAQIKKGQDSKAHSVGNFMASSAAQYIDVYDTISVDHMLKDAKTDPDVGFIACYDNDGKLIVGTEDDKSGLNMFEFPIVENDKKLGKLVIGYKNDELVSGMRNSLLLIIGGLIAFIVVLGGGMVFAIERIVMHPIDRTIDMLKDVASGRGDLTRRLPEDRQDEIGQLSKWFNTFIKSLQEIISSVQGEVTRVSASGEELASTSRALNQSADRLSMQTTRVATSMNEMAQTIITVAGNASDASGASKKAADMAEGGKGSVTKTSEGMRRMADRINETTLTIESLGRGSAEIGSIIRVIDDIADQTNLLALNAAIEAARAGEHGRGFAVVADEVRKLAERTTKATKEIADMIVKIQAETGRSVKSMQASRSEAEEGLKLAEEARTALDMIVQASNNTMDIISHIAAATEEQSSAAEEVNENVQEILSISTELAGSSTQIRATAEDFARISSSLQTRLSQFKV